MHNCSKLVHEDKDLEGTVPVPQDPLKCSLAVA